MIDKNIKKLMIDKTFFLKKQNDYSDWIVILIALILIVMEFSMIKFLFIYYQMFLLIFFFRLNQNMSLAIK